MKLDEKKIKERMESIDPQNRVFIYDASIILEFLRDTYVNPRFYLIDPTLSSEEVFARSNFKNKDDYIGLSQKREKIYDEYVKWRVNKDYTAPIEASYKFGMILGKMRFARNGWQFNPMRRGLHQVVYITPVRSRNDASVDEWKASPLNGKMNNPIIEHTLKDMEPHEEVVPIAEENPLP